MQNTKLKEDDAILDDLFEKYQSNTYIEKSINELPEQPVQQNFKKVQFEIKAQTLIDTFEEINNDKNYEKQKKNKQNSSPLKDFIKQLDQERKKKYPNQEDIYKQKQQTMRTNKPIDLSKISEEEKKRILMKHAKEDQFRQKIQKQREKLKNNKHQSQSSQSSIEIEPKKVNLLKIQKKQNVENDKGSKSFQEMFKEKSGIFELTGKPVFEFHQLLKFLFLKDYQEEYNEDTYTKIPKAFKSCSEYSKIFEYFFLNESVSQLKQEMQRISKHTFRRIQIKLDENEQDKDGSIFQIRMYQKQNEKKSDDSSDSNPKQPDNCDLTALKNYIVILSNKFSFDIDKLNRLNKKRQIFFGMLIEPTQQQFFHQIKIQTYVPQEEIFKNWMSVYLIPFMKITTQIREYLMIKTIECSPLYPLILDPKSLQHLIGSEKEKHWELATTNTITNPRIMDPFFEHVRANFNSSQAAAIEQIVLQEKGISLLQGPPGTGKTHTLIGLLSGVYEYMKTLNKFPKKKILICAPSNAAIDEIVLRILAGGMFDQNGNSRKIKLVRLGVLDEDNEKSDIIKQVSLEYVAQDQLFNKSQLKANKDQKTTSDIKIELGKLSQQIRKIQESDQSFEQKKKLHDLWNQKRQLQSYLEVVREKKRNQKENYTLFCESIINEAEIICSTLSTSGTEKLAKYFDQFEILIVDEAAQCTEPSNNVPLKLGMKKMILIGDPKQLPATTFSPLSSTNYNRSLFERILENNFKPFFLDIQYRMHREIRQFPSFYFYENRLQDHNSIDQRLIPNKFFPQRTLFIDVEGEEEKDEKSFFNFTECQLIIEFLKSVRDTLPSQSLGIICAYKAQVKLIKSEIRKQIGDILDDLQINTVDSFQGQERDIILFSCVRSSQSGGIGFLNDGRRMNVALTRARNALFIFGNAITLGQSQLWKSLLINMNERKLYRQISKCDIFTFKLIYEDLWTERQKKMIENIFQQITEREAQDQRIDKKIKNSEQSEKKEERQHKQNKQYESKVDHRNAQVKHQDENGKKQPQAVLKPAKLELPSSGRKNSENTSLQSDQSKSHNISKKEKKEQKEKEKKPKIFDLKLPQIRIDTQVLQEKATKEEREDDLMNFLMKDLMSLN